MVGTLASCLQSGVNSVLTFILSDKCLLREEFTAVE